MTQSGNIYDVIVVEGGPAGLSTAINTAKLGYSVILLEEHSEIGFPLQCGEYLPTPQEMRDLLPSVPNHDQIFNYPKEAIVHSTKKTQIAS
ncbi:MAG: FAD-binding protein, partial [Candidatus Asgardarchaeia archaeon]